MKAFGGCQHFKEHVCEGKQALDGGHSNDLVETKVARVAKSLNFEAAVQGVRPELRRWDYFIEASHRPNVAHAVEMHNYEPRELKQKRDGTISILRDCCEGALTEIASWQVIIKGEAPRADIAARFRAETRINIAGRKLQISKL